MDVLSVLWSTNGTIYFRSFVQVVEIAPGTLIISYLVRTSSTDPSWTDESWRSLSVLHICSLTRIDRKTTMDAGQVHWWRHHPPQVHQFNGLQLGNSSRDDVDETGKVTLGLASSLWGGYCTNAMIRCKNVIMRCVIIRRELAIVQQWFSSH